MKQNSTSVAVAARVLTRGSEKRREDACALRKLSQNESAVFHAFRTKCF